MTSYPIESRDTFWRSLQALNFTRILIASLLFIFWLMGITYEISSGSAFSYRNICILYLVLAVFFATLTIFDRRSFLVQLLSQTIVDITIISFFYLSSDGMKGGMAILYLVPLASSAILLRMVLALFFASIVTLFLLVENWIRVFNGQTEAHVMQAGLYGASFLAAAYVVNRLADKLIQQETLARQRGLDLQVQQAINRLVIADMDDGVLVVGSDSTVYACNPSAQYELGLLLPDHVVRPKLTEIPYLKPLADAFFAWHANRLAPLRSRIDPVNFLIIKPADDAQWREANSMFGISGLGMHLKVRFANVSTDTIPEERTVIFLQDVARIDHQAQQLKLASMGRLTASVAHEVRNPLSAIAHASSLLSEEATTPSQQRLLKIVADNVGRMNRMVEDILKLSRKAQSHETFLLSELVLDTISSFEDTHALKDGLILADDLRQHRVRFDPMHLREVLLNLLNNAIRYASGQPGSIRIHAAQASYNRLELHVQDDGPSITPEVRAHLFEPFYTTSSHGTGLGLYLARELCSNNGAMLDYEFHNESAGGSHTASSGRFVITFASDIKPQESL